MEPIGNFGFTNNWRKVFNVSKDRVLEFLERFRTEYYEYYPICKRKLGKGWCCNTIDEIAKRRRLLILWWFDRKMNVEVWRRL